MAHNCKSKLEMCLKIYLYTDLWTGPQGTYYPTNHFSRGFDSPAAFWLAHDDLPPKTNVIDHPKEKFRR